MDRFLGLAVTIALLEPCTTPRIPREWRRALGDDSLPIGWITPPGSDLVTLGRHHREMRELQRKTAAKEPGVDLILPGTRHIPFSAQPADEALLGERCLTWLRGAVYKDDVVVHTGPLFDRAVMNYSKAQVFFKAGTAKGLRARKGALDRFEVAGVDLEYSPADALLAAEYYLATGDRNVLPYMRYCCDALTAIQIRSPEQEGPWPEVQKGQTGGWRHNFYGGATYGTMPAVHVPAALGYHLTKEAGVEYNFIGYDRAVNWYLHNGAKVGDVGYGYFPEPKISGNTIDPDKLAAGKLNPGNGGVAGAAILFGLRGNGPVTRTCSFVATHSYNNTGYAHGGHFWANMWTPLGAKVHDKKSFQFFMKGNRNYQELHRMHNHSQQQDRVFGAGQYLAYVAPRERLRILGAHESVFAPNPPAALRGALEAYHKHDYAACETAAASLIEQGDTHGLDLQKAKQLRDAAALLQKSIAHDLAKVKGLIAANKPYEASLDVASTSFRRRFCPTDCVFTTCFAKEMTTFLQEQEQTRNNNDR